jgi:ABC-type uncharacterized transport system substrate-binding protein
LVANVDLYQTDRDRMYRRQFLATLGSGLIAKAGHALAQSPERSYRLGTATPLAAITETSRFGQILARTLAEHGYFAGKNLIWDARSTDGNNARLPAIFDDFKKSRADAVIIVGFQTALAAKSSGIPAVGAIGLGDPVETRLIESLTHPGGNLTGISDDATMLTSKRLQLLKELSPPLRKVAMVWNADDLGMTLRYNASARSAQALGVQVQALGVREPNDFEEAFSAMKQDRPDAILMIADGLTNLNRKRVFEFAAAEKLPAIYEYDFLVRDGGLMSYGPDLTESFERAAALVDRIFKGALPADIPFERPTRYPFLINLNTARTIGIEIPPQLLALADEVIE